VREKEGRCLVEGVRLVDDVHRAGAFLLMVFWERSLLQQPGGEDLLRSRSLLQQPGGEDLLRSLEERRPPGGLFEVEPKILEHLADTETPQGVVGVVGVAARPTGDPRALLGQDRGEGPAAVAAGSPPESREPRAAAATVVILDSLRDPGNVGTVIRSADASGAAGVVFLPGTADPFGPKALRASMGSAFHLPVVAAEETVRAYLPAEALAGDRSRTETASRLPGVLREQGFEILVADPEGDVPHWRAPLGGRSGIVLGNETEGPDPLLWKGAARVFIPLVGRADSLNVGMAAEAARRREGWGR